MRELSLEINKLCNFKCSFCYTDKDRENLPSIELIFALIDQAVGEDVSSISLTGGEPMLQMKRVRSIAEYAKSKNLRVRLNTNGYLLSDSVIHEFKELIDEWQISFNASTNERFSRYTGLPLSAKPFDKILNNIALLKIAGQYVTIRYTLDQNTISDLFNVYNLFTTDLFAPDAHPINKFKLRTVVPAGGISEFSGDRSVVYGAQRLFFSAVYRNDWLPVVIKDGVGILNWDRQFRHIVAPECLCGEGSIHISCDLRRVTPCVFVRDDPKFLMGSLIEGGTSLSDIWRSPIATDFKRKTDAGSACPSHDFLRSEGALSD